MAQAHTSQTRMKHCHQKYYSLLLMHWTHNMLLLAYYSAGAVNASIANWSFGLKIWSGRDIGQN